MADESFAYNYYYLGENGEVWQLSIYPHQIYDQQVGFTKQ